MVQISVAERIGQVQIRTMSYSRTMTLIISVLTNEAVFCSTDTLLSDSNGLVASSAAVKSMAMEINDGKYLVSFAGVAALDNKGTIEWIVDKLTEFNASEKNTDTVIDFIKHELDDAMARSLYPQQYKTLVIVIRGWKYINGHKINQSFTLENRSTNSLLSNMFKLNDFGQVDKPIIEGWTPATQGKLYAKHSKNLSKLLSSSISFSRAYKIRTKLAKLIAAASRNMQGQFIGDKVMGSILFYDKDGIDFAYYPEQPNYNFPPFIGKTISISGGSIKGDFVKGGTTRIGYSDS